MAYVMFNSAYALRQKTGTCPASAPSAKIRICFVKPQAKRFCPALHAVNSLKKFLTAAMFGKTEIMLKKIID